MSDGAPPRSLHEQFDENPQPIVTFVTTEHFALQGSRAASISETTGRASVFLASVSSGLVALAFVGQSSDTGTAFDVFGLVLLPVLVFLGLVTFERILQSSIEDLLTLKRIDRLRRFYLDFAPGLADYLAPVALSDDASDVIRTEGYKANRLQLFVSLAGMVEVVTSVLGGAFFGLVARVLGAPLGVTVAVSAIVFAVSVAGHQRYQMAERVRAWET